MVDFPQDVIGKAIPYGVYDVGANAGFVSVEVDHDMPVFAVTTLEAWWRQIGSKRYPNAHELFTTADAGGSNGCRSHVWKYELQQLADPRQPLTPGDQQVEQKSSTGCSRSSPSTGAAARCAPTRPSST